LSVVQSGRSLEALCQAIAAEGGEPAAALVPPRSGELFGPLAAAGTRTAAAADEYSLLVESIFEGYLLHHWESRILDLPDPDLRLLCGDFLYALGLSRLAELGDLEAVVELADLISLCAAVHAADPDIEGPLPAALWTLSALAVSCGPWPGHAEVKEAVRRGDEASLARAQAELSSRAEETGFGEESARALIAFRETVSPPFGTT
jgi:hypothetical protein